LAGRLPGRSVEHRDAVGAARLRVRDQRAGDHLCIRISGAARGGDDRDVLEAGDLAERQRILGRARHTAVGAIPHHDVVAHEIALRVRRRAGEQSLVQRKAGDVGSDVDLVQVLQLVGAARGLRREGCGASTCPTQRGCVRSKPRSS
jgi:hypothetical protein